MKDIEIMTKMIREIIWNTINPDFSKDILDYLPVNVVDIAASKIVCYLEEEGVI